ncbi:MAG TPA: ABC transporter ATP-binding protein [Planctomycetota bacterium]|nr:ABC transporter ATP-binding protein [Planctomycetota bacterium]
MPDEFRAALAKRFRPIVVNPPMQHDENAPHASETTQVPAVELVGLTKEYDGKRAVDDLTLRVEQGEFFGFLGPNGAGKSTTIKLLCGLLRPTSGRAFVMGTPVDQDPLWVRRHIGVLPEEACLYERLSPLESLRLVGRLHGLDELEITKRSSALLDLMEISAPDRRRLVLDFSMGMRKKVALATALIHGPRLLFLDEPFNGIDAVTMRAIQQVLKDAVARGVTIFFSSHILDVVQRLCSRLAIIHEGKLRVMGTLEQARVHMGADSSATLEDLFVEIAGGGRVKSGGLEFLR